MKAPSALKFITLLLLALNFRAQAQYFPREKAATQAEIVVDIANLNKAQTPAQRLEALLKLGNAYFSKPKATKNDLDSTFLLAQQAKALSLQTKNNNAFVDALKLIIAYYDKTSAHTNAMQNLKVLPLQSRVDMLSYLGTKHFNMAYSFKTVNLSYLDTVVIFCKQRLLVSKQLKKQSNIDEVIKHLEQLLWIFNGQANRLRFNDLYSWVKINVRSLKAPFPSAELSARLTQQDSNEGNYDKALDKILYSLKLTNDQSPSQQKLWVYAQAGEIYRMVHKYEKSNFYYQKILSTPDEYPGTSMYLYAYMVCNNLLQMKQNDQAISFITELQKRTAPKTTKDKIYLYRTLGENYMESKQLALALDSWTQALNLAQKTNNNFAGMYINQGAIYIKMQKYTEADEAFAQCEQRSVIEHEHAAFWVALYAFRSQVKAKLGDYQSALIYLQKNKHLTDSVYSATKNKQIQELDIKYETQKKEILLKQRADSISFLNQKNRLQQQNARLQKAKLSQAQQLAQSNKAIIKLRERDIAAKTKDYQSVSQIAALQSAKLQQADMNKKITAVIIGLLLVIIGLVYYQFRQKRKSNRIVTQKNEQLNKLLDEKEWLLKEIHHRVKNNLQTIVNLLESQSAHLEEPAFTAIETSKNRIFAMSLIHHKLYLSDENSKIDMAVYINELTCFLRETFSGGSLVFNINIDPIKLDATRAIPIGLIINEAVTNSLKHAFNNVKTGRVDISFLLDDDNHAVLTIADNGCGMPALQLSEASKTMGLKLIKGLTRQLDAKLLLNTNNGTSYTISSISLTDVLHTV